MSEEPVSGKPVSEDADLQEFVHSDRYGKLALRELWLRANLGTEDIPLTDEMKIYLAGKMAAALVRRGLISFEIFSHDDPYERADGRVLVRLGVAAIKMPGSDG